MTSLALLGVIAFSAFSVVVAIFLARCWFEELYGDLAVQWLLPKEILHIGSMVLFLTVATLVGMKMLAGIDPDVLMVPAYGVGLGALWGAWWIVARDRSLGGVILVDLGQAEPRGMIAVAAFAVLGMGALALTIVQRDLFMALQALFFASSAAMSYLITKMHTVFTAKGIYTPNGFLDWAQVEAYRWTGGTGKSHTLVLRVKRRVFKTKILRVPWHAFDDVCDVMEGLVGALILEDPKNAEAPGREESV
jgi:hypothetical protein